MKKLLFYVVIAFAILSSSDMMAQQGFGTNTPDKSAAVDIVSTKRGLLMPRIALTSTTASTPVANPHNALMVYNTATAGVAPNNVTPGFYYWAVTAFNPADPTAATSKHGAGKWVRMVDADDITATTVSEGNGIKVKETTDVDGNTDYQVRTEAGNATEKYMMTIANPAFVDIVTTPDEDPFMTTWVDKEDFLNDLLDVENGLTFDPATGSLKLGGALTDAVTTISTGANQLEIDATGGVFTLTGIEAWDNDPAADDALSNAKIVVLNADGTMRTIDYSDSIYTADNGLTMTDNNVQLGGTLTKATTEIDINNKDLIFNVSDAAGGGSMQIKGLTNATAENTLVVRDADGVLHQVVRSASATTAADLVISGGTVTNYSPYVPEVNIAVTLAAVDVDVTLPAVADAKGQVINIRITNSTDAHDGYCNILLPGGGTLTYGAMPYQGWIVKSDGTNWVVVGRN